MKMRLFTLLGMAALAACSPPLTRLALTPTTSQLELRPIVASIMVREISLPTYAAEEEIAFENENGLISTDEDILWADDPQRAASLLVTRNLTEILGADVGPDPWPFVGLPDVVVEIRVERILAGRDGRFQLAGQYYIGGDAIDFPNSTSTFEITKTVTRDVIGGIANAQSEALVTLSEEIARKLAR